MELEPNAAPIFIKPCPVLFYMRSKLDAEYKGLQDTGIVAPVRTLGRCRLQFPF